MSWESIIGFIFIILISSLFNKGKGGQHTRRSRRPNYGGWPPVRPIHPEEIERRSKTEEVYEEKKISTDKGVHEIQQESTWISFEGKEDVKPLDNQEKSIFEKDSVYFSEIGVKEEPMGLDFDSKSIIHGIIMSEILGKPKCFKK